MDPELDLLRRRVEYLEQHLFASLERIAALEYRIAELERRPLTVLREQEAEAAPRRTHVASPRVKEEAGKVAEMLLDYEDWEQKESRER